MCSPLFIVNFYNLSLYMYKCCKFCGRLRVTRGLFSTVYIVLKHHNVCIGIDALKGIPKVLGQVIIIPQSC